MIVVLDGLYSSRRIKRNEHDEEKGSSSLFFKTDEYQELYIEKKKIGLICQRSYNCIYHKLSIE